MNHGSLFSGIGGFDLAASWLGWNNVFQCEKDDFCQKVLKYHFPKTELYGDITKTDFRKYRGKIDVISGGFPCQPFSLAGQRKGKDDDRYLWPEMLRVIDEVRPSWVVGENVAGITSMVQPGCEIEVESQVALFEAHDKETILKQEYVVETICRDFESIGYSIQPILIPACAVGAPHRRDRVWFIAHRSDAGIEGVQRAWEGRVSSASASTHANSNDAGRCGYGKVSEEAGESKKKQEEWQWIRSEFERTGRERNASDTNFVGSERRKKLGGCSKIKAPKKQAKPIGLYECAWQNFPTQPPICSRNDGFSSRLDGISFSKWRNESIKAYGNAIVPQVACEIFKIINFLNQ